MELISTCSFAEIATLLLMSGLLIAASAAFSSAQAQQFGGGVPGPEGFFLNGSSFAVTSGVLSLAGGSSIGFSFRTCTPGELLKQTSETFDQLELRVVDSGRLVLRLTTGDERSLDVAGGSDLLDGLWHTVAVEVAHDQSRITLTVRSPGRPDDVASSERADVIRDVSLSAGSPQLRVGAGMVACIREGPGVRFTKPEVAVHSSAVSWQRCLLPYTCSGEMRKTGGDLR